MHFYFKPTKYRLVFYLIYLNTVNSVLNVMKASSKSVLKMCFVIIIGENIKATQMQQLWIENENVYYLQSCMPCPQYPPVVTT